jgi:hypothetical protein
MATYPITTPVNFTGGNTITFTGTTINDFVTTATGDTIYASSATALTRLPIGSANQVMTVSGGGLPSWAAAPSTTVMTVNGSATGTAIDFDDATPAAPAGGTNVLWQKDALSPINISAYCLNIPTIVKKTADQTFNATGPANVTSLVFSVTSGRYYYFRWVMLVRSDTSTIGVRADMTVPAFTRFGATGRTIFAGDGAGAEFQGAMTASADAVVPTAVPAINTDYVWQIDGLILPSAGGSIQVRAGTETGVTTVTVRQGSMGLLWDLGT